ncbi:MAG: hypothetical protein WAO20_18400 [Acidobacteriota bacterium]
MFKTCLGLIVTAYLVAFGTLVAHGMGYYLTPLPDRAFHPLHSLLKPSGGEGRLLGIVGGSMMLLTFLYTIRKRSHFLQRFGNQKQWLQVHIFLGLGGPALVALHTTGKLGGLAAIGFYSTMAMVLSGIIGRYLYSKIPRTRKGNEMSLAQIEQQLSEWVAELGSDSSRDRLLEALEQYLARVRQQRRGLVMTVAVVIADDLKGFSHVHQAWRISGIQGKGLRRRVRVVRLVLKQRRLLKKLAVLEASQRLFSYWHIFHRPFTILASVLILIHIAVATYFGYGVNW